MSRFQDAIKFIKTYRQYHISKAEQRDNNDNNNHELNLKTETNGSEMIK